MSMNERFKQATEERFIFLPQMALSCFCFSVFGRNIMRLLLLPGITMKFTCTSNENCVITAAWPQWFKNASTVDKEDMVHIYNGILLSHKKEQNNAICGNMDGPKDYHTCEVSQT